MKILAAALIILAALASLLFLDGRGKGNHSRRFWLLFLCLLSASSLAYGKGSIKTCIKFEIATGIEQPDKEQAKRLYLKACHWVEENITTHNAPLRPCVTVHLITEFPAEMASCGGDGHACFRYNDRSLWMKQWNGGAFAKAVIYSAIMESLPNEELEKAAQGIIDADEANFLRIPKEEEKK